MIFLSFFFDFLINQTLPLNSYFIVAELDKNKFLSVVLTGLFLDYIFHKPFIHLTILILLYLSLKCFSNSKKHTIIKNIIIYLVYFHLTYFLFGHSTNYCLNISIGLILQIFYLKIAKLLLK